MTQRQANVVNWVQPIIYMATTACAIIFFAAKLDAHNTITDSAIAVIKQDVSSIKEDVKALRQDRDSTRLQFQELKMQLKMGYYSRSNPTMLVTEHKDGYGNITLQAAK